VKCRSVMLVDDSVTRCKLRIMMLATHGYQVEHIKDAAAAFERCQAHAPDLVLVALSGKAKAILLWQRLSHADPKQRVAFVAGDRIYLGPSASADDGGQGWSIDELDELCRAHSPQRTLGSPAGMER